MNKILRTSLLIGFLACFSCNSSQNEADGSAEPDQLKIAVIPKGTTHFFWKHIHAGAAKAAKELDVEIIWQGPLKEDDRQMQIQVVQNFVSRAVDAIVLAPLDEQSLVPPVRAAMKRKIPVIIIDSGLSSDDYLSFVATDNYLGGKLCAQRMIEILEGKGKVIMLRYQEGSASTSAREQGFLDAIEEQAPGIELISTNQYAGATMEKGFQASQNLLNRFQEIDGIFTPNESATLGMLRALEVSNKKEHIKFVGFDTSDVLLKALEEGTIDGLAVQDPFKMGYLGVKTAVEAINGSEYPDRIDTGIAMVTSNNMAESEIQLLLNPEIEKWLDE